jgi:hypothetical protein
MPNFFLCEISINYLKVFSPFLFSYLIEWMRMNVDGCCVLQKIIFFCIDLYSVLNELSRERITLVMGKRKIPKHWLCFADDVNWSEEFAMMSFSAFSLGWREFGLEFRVIRSWGGIKEILLKQIFLELKLC